MNANQRPTLEDLSRYIDGLTSETEQDWICKWLAEDGSLAKELRLLDTLQTLAAEEVPEPEAKLFTDARAAILDQVKKERRQTAPGSIPWLIQFLSPKRLMPLVAGACAMLLAVAVLTNPGDRGAVQEKGNRDKGPHFTQAGPEPTPYVFELSPEQEEEAQAAMQMLASAAEWVGEETSGIRGTASGRILNARDYIENNGQALWQTGTDTVGDIAETILDTGKTTSEPIADWTVKQARFQAGTSLLSLALGVV